MNYRIEFVKKAAKQFKALSSQERKRIKAKIDTLVNEPRPSGVVKLSGKDNLYRIRVGIYRVIHCKNIIFLVIKQKKCRDIMQNLYI